MAESSADRNSFDLRAPFAPGTVYSALVDKCSDAMIHASSCKAYFGMNLLRSGDLGRSFEETSTAPAFPQEDSRALANIWSLEAGDNPGELWEGIEPASLFRSDDGGNRWGCLFDSLPRVNCVKAAVV